MDEKLPEWLEQCLTEDDRQLIGIVGTEAFLRLIDTYGGGNVYIGSQDNVFYALINFKRDIL